MRVKSCALTVLLVFSGMLSIAFAGTNDGLPGDVNGSGIVNQVDAALIKDHLLERSLLTGEALIRADANEDGNVDLEDVSWIVENPSEQQIAPNVIVVDNVEDLTALDWTEPTLLLRWTGATAHGIAAGDILVGSDFDGFLVEVISVSENNDILSIFTTQATLAEVLEHG